MQCVKFDKRPVKFNKATKANESKSPEDSNPGKRPTKIGLAPYSWNIFSNNFVDFGVTIHEQLPPGHGCIANHK